MTAKSFGRFIALGDSITEGLSDIQVDGKHVGWADRTATALAQRNATGQIEYLNLAVRGKLLQQMIDEQIDIATAHVVPEQTLISFYAGANNVLRPSYDATHTAELYRKAVSALVSSDAKVVLFCIREIDEPKSALQIKWNQRFGPFNEMVRELAIELDCALVDPNQHPVFADPRFIADDRLHLSSLGHQRLAEAVLVSLGMGDKDALLAPLPDLPKESAIARIAKDALWVTTFVGPWVVRRLTGKSSGDGRTAKYPNLVTWPIH